MELTKIEDLWKYAKTTDLSLASSGYKGLNLAGKVGFTKILLENSLQLFWFYQNAKRKKECYVGPFIGELGNLLGNMLPFLGFLHKSGIKVHYCGLSLHKPLIVDDKGNSLVETFEEVRDILGETQAAANSFEYMPEDVAQQLDKFISKGNASGLPFLDIYTKSNLYWYTFRNWQLKGRQHIYDLSKLFSPEGKKSKVVIFPRKKQASYASNNGASWDYNELALLCVPFFDEVVFVGHPSMSAALDLDHPKITSELSFDNTETLKSCAEARLLISQHSGAMQFAPMINADTLCIYNGQPPIGNFSNTIRFRKPFPPSFTNLVFSKEEIVEYLQFRADKGLNKAYDYS